MLVLLALRRVSQYPLKLFGRIGEFSQVINYEKRLRINIEGNNITEFYSSSHSLLVTGYKRIVLGSRGPYIESTTEQINFDNFYIPNNELWRVHNEVCYYVESRSRDKSCVKLYYQKKLVNYADYKIGFYYISPFDLYVDNEVVIRRLNEG